MAGTNKDKNDKNIISLFFFKVERQNANVNDVDYSNNTPLHYAAASGNEAILTYLLEKNARIMISTSGNTPLHVVRNKLFS
jgi:ankyrin repeat protein